jgi:hypothetical protein
LAQADTNVGGAIAENAVWSAAQGPYVVTSDVIVQNGATLTIEAGTTVYMGAGASLTIQAGSIQSLGTTQNSIRVTSQKVQAGQSPAAGDWNQWVFNAGAVNTKLEHILIEYGKGLAVNGSAPIFNYLNISNHQGPAIAIDLAASPSGVGNQASGNALNAVAVPSGDIAGGVTWGLQGIPYLVASGTVSVGASPTVTSVSPASVQQGETLTVALAGTRLSGLSRGSFDKAGLTADVVAGGSDTAVNLTVNVAAGAAVGTSALLLLADAGEIRIPNAITVIQTQPKLTALNPASIYAGQGAVQLELAGKNFSAQSVALLNGAEIPTHYVSDTLMRATVPSQDSAATTPIKLRTPDPANPGQFLISNVLYLTAITPQLALSPASATIINGATYNLTLTLPFSAPSGGLSVNLASSGSTVATVPAAVTIAEGATTSMVPVTATGLGVATITASKPGFANAPVQVMVVPPPTLTLTSSAVTLETGKSATLTITSNVVAGTGGLSISLTSSNPAVATVPASVIIPFGAKSITATMTTLAVGTATITAQATDFVVGSVAVAVRPITQSLTVSPYPVAIPPDNVARKVTLRLASVDAIDHVFAISAVDTTIVGVSPASLMIPAGQTSVQLSVTGKKEGSTTVNLVSATLGTTAVPVYVTTEYAGINMSYAPLVGVVKELPPQPASSMNISPLVSSVVGVAYGSFIRNLAPTTMAIGTGPTVLTINGEGLQNATSVSIVPNDGLTIGSLTASPDGKSVTVPVTVSSSAATTYRQVIVSGSSGRYTPALPNADRLLITFPMPEVTSVEPLFASPGASAMNLIVRGRNLQNAQPVIFNPADGMSVGASSSVNADGTQLNTTLSISSSAALGSRVVQVATPAGMSDGMPSVFNTFTLVSQVQNSVTPISAPLVGVVKEVAASPPATQAYGLYSGLVGVALGGTVTGLAPSAGAIGNTVTLTISGNELQGVTSIQFAPSTGLTVGALVAAPDGKSVTVSVSIAADAPQVVRAVKVMAGTASIPFSSLNAAMFRVILPVASVDSVDPIVLPIPSSALTLGMNGINFQNASAIRITPSTGVTVANPPAVSADGKRATASISVASGTAGGQRVVTIVTPAGETTAEATLANTVTLTATPGPTYGPISSPLVGVVKETVVQPITMVIDLVASPLVGVMMQQIAPPPASTSIYQPSPLVGVAMGSVAINIAPKGLLVGTTGNLTVNGFGLDAVTAITLNPATGVTSGAIQVNADGTQLTVPLNVATSAPIGLREVVLTKTGGRVIFANPAAGRLWLAPGAPSLDSISPNLASQGSSIATFTIRGSNFQGATAVTAEPAGGIVFGYPTVNADGTVLTVGMSLMSDAPVGARVIRVTVPGVTSAPDPVPANTFNVYLP